MAASLIRPLCDHRAAGLIFGHVIIGEDGEFPEEMFVIVDEQTINTLTIEIWQKEQNGMKNEGGSRNLTFGGYMASLLDKTRLVD